MPRADRRDPVAAAGLSLVKARFELLGWMPVEIPAVHDKGTDLWIGVRDERRFETGRIMGAQVKSGPSYFESPNLDPEGWWYAEGDADHFSGWAKHECPHLLILCDIDTETCYWVHVTADQCITTGQGVKILVPKKNILNRSAFCEVMNVFRNRPTILFSGTIFDAAAYKVAPEDRVRTALLLPRIIAPHPNRKLERPIEPEEVLALLVQFEFHRFRFFLDGCADWPEIGEKPTSRDFRWHVVAALWQAVSTNSLVQIEGLHKSGSWKRPDWKAAVAVILATQYFNLGRTKDACSIVAEVAIEDKCGPLDQAWLWLHQAWYLAELDSLADSVDFIEKSIAILELELHDSVAAFLLGSAVTLRHRLDDGYFEKSPKILINARDNQGNWWRDQHIGWTLIQAQNDRFKVWARPDGRGSFVDSKPPENGFRAAILNSALAADTLAWCNANSEYGKYALTTNPIPNRSRGLLNLLLSGNDGSFADACGRYWSEGPAEMLTDLSRTCQPTNFSRTRFKTMLRFWEEFGDVACIDASREICHWAMDEIIKTPDPNGTAFGLTSSNYRESVAAALCGALVTQNDSFYVATLKIALRLDLATPSNKRVVFSLARSIAGKLKSTELSSRLLEIEASSAWDAREKAQLLGVAHLLGSDRDIVERLERAVKSGDRFATSELLFFDLLTPDLATVAIDKFSEWANKYIANAERGKHGVNFSHDPGEIFASLNAKFPKQASWDPLMRLILSPSVLADTKHRAIRRLVAEKSKLPTWISETLLCHAEKTGSSELLNQNHFDHAPRRKATELVEIIKFGMSEPGQFDITNMLGMGENHQIEFLRLLALRPDARFDYLLMGLFQSASFRIKRQVAEVAGKLASGEHGSDALTLLVSLIAKDRGCEIILRFLNGAEGKISPSAASAIKSALNHPSARVREGLEKLLMGA